MTPEEVVIFERMRNILKRHVSDKAVGSYNGKTFTAAELYADIVNSLNQKGNQT